MVLFDIGLFSLIAGTAQGIAGAARDAFFAATTAATTKYQADALNYLKEHTIDPPTIRNEGPRLRGVKPTLAEEGLPIPFVFGNRVRVPAILHWQSKHFELEGKIKSSAGKSSSSTTVFRYEMNLHWLFAETPGTDGLDGFEKVWANGKNFWNENDPDKNKDRYSQLTFKDGAEDMTPNALLTASWGEEATPAFLGIAQAVVNRCRLEDFNNGPPQASARLRPHPDTFGRADAIKLLCERAGLVENDDFDVSDVDNAAGSFKGMVLEDIQPMARAIDTIRLAYDVDVQRHNGVLRFFQRENAVSLFVEPEKVGARAGEFAEQGEEHPYVLQMPKYRDLPNEVNIQFYEDDAKVHPGSQTYRRTVQKSSGVLNLNIPLTLSADEAKEIATNKLVQHWQESDVQTTVLPPSKDYVEEGDVIEIPSTPDTLFSMRILSMSLGADGTIEVTGPVFEKATYILATVPWFELQGASDGPEADEDVDYEPPALRTELLDLPPLSSDTVEKISLYWTHSSLEVPGIEWKGALLYRETVNALGSYQAIEFNDHQAIQGQTENNIGAAGAWGTDDPFNLFLFDEASALQVVLDFGELLSRTDDEILSGMNYALVGDEILAFVNATLIGEDGDGRPIYELTRLLRGLRGTENTVLSHSLAERFVLLDDTNLRVIPLTLADVNKAINFKDVPVGSTPDDVSEILVPIVGNQIAPFSPVNLDRLNNWPSTGDITLQWTGRSRAIFDPFDGEIALPLYESRRAFLVSVLNGSLAVVRQWEVEDSEEVVYTAAEQTSDWGASQVGNVLKVKVQPWSDFFKFNRSPAQADVAP